MIGATLPRLAGVREIADLCGVSTRTASRYVDRDDFPRPIGELAASRVWLQDDIKRWASVTLPLPGRPPGT